MNKKLIIGIIIGGLIFGSIGVYAGTKFYASDVSVNAPTGSNLGSDATLQGTLDELYSIADKYDELNKKINALENSSLSLDKMYPIGSIFFSTDITDPNDVSKKIGGTWEAYGAGKTLVGVDTSNTNFNTVSKTGGSSTTTLTISNLPSHNHSIPSLRGTISKSGGHTHTIANAGSVWYNSAGTSATYYTNNEYTGVYLNSPSHYGSKVQISISGDGSHTHSVTTNTSTTGSTGSGTAFSNLQPYITVYMYKRVK